MPLNTPLRFTATIRSKLSSAVSATGDRVITPALLTSTWTPPNACSAASNSADTAAGSATSARTATARPPAASILATSAVAASAFPA